jgi:hypothetical protein
MHSKMQFKQQKIAILSKFTSPDSPMRALRFGLDKEILMFLSTCCRRFFIVE